MSQQHFPSKPMMPNTWREIEQLVDQVADLAQQHASLESFYVAVLDRAMRSLAADAGFVWLPNSGGQPLCLCQAGSDRISRPATIDEHAQLAAIALDGGKPTAMALRGDGPVDDASPTPFALFGTVVHAGQIAAVIEIVLPPETSQQSRKNGLQVIEAIGELATDFHHRRVVDELERTRQQGRQVATFSDRLHQSLDLNHTAFSLANDGRRLVGCDRLTVLRVRRSRCKILSVSGVDVVDRRSQSARLLVSFVNRVAAVCESVWYHGQSEDMPPELQGALDAYINTSHARRLGALPLRANTDDSTAVQERPVMAVLVGEDFDARRTGDEFECSLESIARTATTALNNSFRYHNIPFVTVLARLARLRWFVQAGRLPVTILVLLMFVASLIVLTWVPSDFAIQARGTLQPEIRRRLFSPEQCIVEKVLVEHAQQVKQGQLLLQLHKPELELSLTRVAGDLQTTRQRLKTTAARRFLTGNRGSRSQQDSHQLAAEEESLKQRVANLVDQQEIIQQRMSALAIHSPIDGQVLTWDVSEQLIARPIARGEELLTVADPSGPWKLMLQVADRDVQHILSARQRLQPALPVEYRLATRPQATYQGELSQVAARSEWVDGNGPTVTVTVRVDSSQVELLRPGAEVIADIHCGRRSIGYVWFRDIWELIQRNVPF